MSLPRGALRCFRYALIALSMPCATAAAARPAPGNGYDTTAILESHDSRGGRFRVWYVRGTVDGVDETDTAPANGIPDIVELVAHTADDVHAVFTNALGFRSPLEDTEFSPPQDVGGDSRFDIYLRNFGAGDGKYSIDACQDVQLETHCTGHFEMERDFRASSYATPSEAVRVLVSHEYFHAIQAAYRVGTDPKWSEGTATWAEEIYDPQQQDFERLLESFFRATHRPFDRASGAAFDGYAYGAAAFPWFLGERFGHDFIRLIWEDLASHDEGFLDLINRRLQNEAATNLYDEWVRFSRYNLFTSVRADPEISYSNAYSWPSVIFEEHSTVSSLPHLLSAAVEGMSARYVPIIVDAPQEVVLRAEVDGPPVHLSLNVWTEAGPVEFSGSSGEDVRVSLVPGVAYLVLTSAVQGAPVRRVDMHFATPPPPPMGPDTEARGCGVGGRPGTQSGAVFLVLLALGIRSRRRDNNANDNYLHFEPNRTPC